MKMKTKRFRSGLLLMFAGALLLGATIAQSQPSPAEKPDFALVAKYAPLIYLHPEESFMPSSLEDFAQNVHMECDGRTLPGNIFDIKTSDLPPGEGGPSERARCRLSSNLPLRNAYAEIPFFHGRKPTAEAPVPVYVFTYGVKSADTFNAQYNTFYPYNRGKDGCPLFVVGGTCTSPYGRKVFDNHVADWELMSIRFVHGKPVSVHVGAHGNDETGSEFSASTYVERPDPNGNTVWASLTTEYMLKDAVASIAGRGPWFLEWQGDHPIAYSAKGSHGLWASPGTHVYRVAAGDMLSDDAGKGAPWETWRAIVNTADPKYNTLLYHYGGDWGNEAAGWSVCRYIQKTIDAAPLGWLGRMGYELYTGKDACDEISDKLRTTRQLNAGPTIPDRNRDEKYVDPKMPGMAPPCEVPPLKNSVVYGLGRDYKLYRKTNGLDGPWSAVPSEATPLKTLVSITARPDSTLLGLDKDGALFELPPPYSAAWKPSAIPANAGVRGLGMSLKGELLGVVKSGIVVFRVDKNLWEPFAVGLTNFVPPTQVAAMPNGNFMLGVPQSPGAPGFIFEYKADEGLLEPLTLGAPKSRPVLEAPFFPAKLTKEMAVFLNRSFTVLPNGSLFYYPRGMPEKIILWTVDSCGVGTSSNLSNEGGPAFGTNPSPDAPQWQSLTVVTPPPPQPPQQLRVK